MNGRFQLARDRVVNAGAGTGKTYALITQYLHLCAGLTAHGRAIEPRALCALTFTEKAAGELRERLQQRVAKIVAALGEGRELVESERELVASAAALGRELPGVAVWGRLREQLQGASIGTFHSFAAGLLRRYAGQAGVDPDFVLLDEDRARELLLLACEHTVLLGLEGGLVEVSAEEVAQLVSEYGFAAGAGGGGGLVEGLARLYGQRAEEGKGGAGLAAAYEPSVLWAELLRVRGAVAEAGRGLLGLSEQLGKKSAEALGELPERLAEVLGCVDAERAEEGGDGPELRGIGGAVEGVLGVLKRLRAKAGKQADPAVGERLREGKERLREGLADLLALRLSRRAAPLARAVERLLGPMEADYAQRKRGEGGLDFTDLLRRARDLLRDDAAVRAAVRARYAVLLVDELQDTSPLQAELVALIAGPLAGESAEPGRLYVVGDRKQSIYAFRGADVAAYSALCAGMRAVGADEETQGVSRRSLPSILRLVNTLFARVMQPAGELLEASGWYVRWDAERDALRASRDEDGRGTATVELLRAGDAEAEAREEGAGEEAEEGETATGRGDPIGREAELLTRRVLGLLEEGRGFGEIVVLLRRFTHLGRYTGALRRAGVPHYVVRGRGFYQAQEILDLAALLTLLDDPEDRLALLSVLRSPLCGLSDEALVRLHLVGALTLGGLLGREGVEEGLSAAEGERLLRLLGVLRGLLAAGERLGPAGCLRAAIDQTDFLAVLAADLDGEQRIANVERLLGRARLFEQGGEGAGERRGGLRGFVRALRLLTDPQLEAALGERPDEPAAQVLGEADDVVRIMTVHQAKGLEFPVVLVAGCAGTERVDQPLLAYDRAVGLGLKLSEEGERAPTLAWQLVSRLGRLRAEAESARLFYVAATRARDRLIFLGESRRRAPRGSWREQLDGLVREAGSAELIRVRGEAELPPGGMAVVGEEEGASLLGVGMEQAAERAVAVVYDLPQRREAARGLRMTAAQWVELLVCPRRLRQGGAELLRGRGGARPFWTEEAAELPLVWLAQGGVVNRLLLHCEVGSPGTELEFAL